MKGIELFRLGWKITDRGDDLIWHHPKLEGEYTKQGAIWKTVENLEQWEKELAETEKAYRAANEPAADEKP